MANVWCVRADGGAYTEHFVRGHYFGYGGHDWPDLTGCRNFGDVRDILKGLYPEGTEPSKIGVRAGMVTVFLLRIQPGDWVITPLEDSTQIRFGEVQPGACQYEVGGHDGCPYPLRRRINWVDHTLRVDSLSIQLRNSLRHTQKSVFAVKYRDDFLAAIGDTAPPDPHDHSEYTVSIHYDRRLYRQDIAGSKAHAAMLAQ